jgi:two-component system alkaline phosphatase synthesis response regulator PhoP
MTKILVAEDEPDIRELITFTLQFAGFEIITVNNGAELVERAPEVKPDIIVSDVRMPRMTGYEACKALKENPDTAAIPFLFLSAKGQEEEVKAGLASGGDDYILKPFSPDELVFRIKQMMAKIAEGQAVKKPAAPEEPKPPQIVVHTPPKEVSPHGTKPLNPGAIMAPPPPPRADNQS